MPGPWQQWLYFHNGDALQEVVNGARTAVYLRTLGIDGIDLCSILDFAGCPAYASIPAAVDSSDNPIVDQYDCSGQVDLEFDLPSTDPAPWYTSDFTESGNALGFYIEEWTGLDSSHISRAASPRGGGSGGVSFGPSSTEGRVQKFNVLLLAKSPVAMQYLFDWLDGVLIGSCSACATDSMLMRRYCPDDQIDGFAFDMDAIAEMRRVALTEGLRWESDIEGRGKCFIRRASFTLTAGDPCIYGLGEQVSKAFYPYDMADCITDTTWDPDRYPCRPSCSELDADCVDAIHLQPGSLEFGHAGIFAPIITLENDFDTSSLPFRVLVYEQDAGISVADRCGSPLLGEIYVNPLPAYSRLTWDIAGRRILYRDATTGVDVETSAFLAANDPPIPRWFSFSCYTDALVVMEPATLCMEADGSELIWAAGGHTFTDPHYPTMSAHVNYRYSCP